MGTEPVLRAEHLVKTYGGGHAAVRAVGGVSLTVARGEMVVIMGPSGSGKTTLVSMLGALLSPDAGTVLVDGAAVTGLREAELAALRARKIGFVFQAFNLLEALTVLENVLFPAQLAPGGMAAARPRADALLQRLGLAGRRRALPGTLSGGEKQRVAIARALVNEPCLIFADEPTGNLDSQTGQEVMMILYEVARDHGCAVVLVTHDQRVIEIADRVLWLEDGTLRDRKVEPQAWAADPVCGMRIDRMAARWSAEHGGRRHYFCSHRCLDRFHADPGRFLGREEGP